jgi:hypothetical protein
MSKKNLDTLINKWISRKLFVFLIASGLLMFADLESSDWTLIAVAYLSSQTVLDSVTIYSKIKNTNNNEQA